MSEQNLNPELSALADALTQLKPRPTALDRDTLMFRAGQASAPRGWKWPLATAALTLVAIGLGVALLFRPQPAVVVQTIHVPVPISAPEKPTPEPKPLPPAPETSALVSHEREPAPQSDYQRLEEHLIRWGFDGLPPMPYAAPPKETRDSLLNAL